MKTRHHYDNRRRTIQHQMLMLVLFIFALCIPSREAFSEENLPDWPSGPRKTIPPRELAKDEVKISRDKEEDTLRADLLARCHDEAQIAKLQTLLNAPWNKESLEYLWESAFRRRVVGTDEVVILKLLVYLRTKHDGCDVGEFLRAKIDGLYNRFREAHVRQDSVFEKNHGAAFEAIEAYGSSKLLTPAFWKLFQETAGGGGALLGIVAAFGDENALGKMKEFESAYTGDKRFWNRTIAAIESRLAKEKKQEEPKKP